MKQIRPYRRHEVFAAPCIICKEEIESDTLPVPWICYHCKEKIRSQVKIEPEKIAIQEYPEACKCCGTFRIGIQDNVAYFSCGTSFNLPPKSTWRFACQRG